jgi:hypothetical protein
LIQGVGQAALNTGINIVTNQFRNVIAGEITSMTNGGGVYAQDAFGEIAKNVGDFFNFGGGGFSPDIGGIADFISSPF